MQKPPLNSHPDLSSGARCLIFCLSLPLLPYFVYAKSKGSGSSEPSLLNYTINTKISSTGSNYSSGEEDEIREFSYRAKLFRFDKDANQWKEKGLGEMKILRHKETGQLINRGSLYTCAHVLLN